MFNTGHEFTRIVQTTLPANLRPTTRECVHLVTRGHFRSREEDGDTIFDPTYPKTLRCTQTARRYVIEAELSKFTLRE